MARNDELRRPPERQQRTTQRRARTNADPSRRGQGSQRSQSTQARSRTRQRSAGSAPRHAAHAATGVSTYRQQQARSGGQARPQARRAAQSHARAEQPIPARGHQTNRRAQPRRRRSPLPLILALVAVVALGVGGFFIVRSCARPGAAGSGDAAQAAANGGENNAAQAAVDDGSVDINLLMVGDILYHYQVRMSGLKADGTRDYTHVFEHFAPELEGYDIKVLNQETPLAGEGFPGNAPDGYSGFPVFNGPQEIGDAEAEVGFNTVLKATNHAMDMDYAGITSEQTFWRTKHPEMAIIGEVDPEDEDASVSDVYVFEKDGFRVALLNYTQDLNGFADPQGCISMLEENQVRDTMAKAREQADMIVVFPHWGVEYETTPNDDQRYWAQVFMDEGADVIIGNHPHVMQPAELLVSDEGKVVPCYWSTGNFISTSPENMSLLGGVPELTLHKDADGKCSITSAKLTVVATHLGLSTDMTTYLLRDWNNDLAASNWLNTEVNPNTDNTGLTVEWANEFCTQVLGSDFDTKTGTLTLDLEAAREKAAAAASEEETGSDASGEDVDNTEDEAVEVEYAQAA